MHSTVYGDDVLLAAGGGLRESQSEECFIRVWRFIHKRNVKFASKKPVKLREHEYIPSFARGPQFMYSNL